MSATGHLFVCHADLTRVSCDAVVAPCDGSAMLRRDWEQFMPEGTVPVMPGWVRLPSARDTVLNTGHAEVVGRDGTITQLVSTYGFEDVEAMVAQVIESVRRAAARAEPGGGRLLPLVALPLVGTGAGGLAHRRGVVIERLLPALEHLVSAEPFDVALVLYDARDHAAVQARRDPEAGRAELGDLADGADRLGRLAASGGLSLFVGSGVSIPLGLPSWRHLLEKLGGGREIGPDDDLLAVAEEIVTGLPDQATYQDFMVREFDRSRHTLGHALLAGLRVRQMVTTNYDPCLELALDRIHGRDGFQVMTRSLPEGDQPWLLKLHGDIKRPDRLVLTRSEYDRLERDHRPLLGVVEGLMMTSHLLFVGFGMQDDDYVKLARRVAVTRDEAEVRDVRQPVGTALTLDTRTGEKAHLEGLTVLSMTGGTDEADQVVAARRIEVFLDRLLMRATLSGAGATAYFLDDRFAEAFATAADISLRNQLLTLAGDRSTLGSAGREAVEKLLHDLGLEPDSLATGG